MTESLYSSLTKKEREEQGEKEDAQDQKPFENEALVERDLHETQATKEVDPASVEEWQHMKTRWSNLGVVYERLVQAGQALNEEDVLFGIQQLDNAKSFIGNARAEIEKAFKYECDQMAAETKMLCPLTAPWVENPIDVKSVPRESKEPVFLHEEQEVEEDKKEESKME